MTSGLLSTDKIKVAVITGHHSFDVPGFYGLFRSIADVDFYMQSLDAAVCEGPGLLPGFGTRQSHLSPSEFPRGRCAWDQMARRADLRGYRPGSAERCAKSVAYGIMNAR